LGEVRKTVGVLKGEEVESEEKKLE